MNAEQVLKLTGTIRTSLFTGTHDLPAVEHALNELEKLAKADSQPVAKPPASPAPSASTAPSKASQ